MAGGRPKVADTLAIESTGASALVVGGAPGATAGTGGTRGGSFGNADGSSTFTGVGTALTALNASNLSTGTAPTARLGTGTANASTVLLGNSTWGSYPGATTLLYQASGQSTGTGASTAASVTMTGVNALTVKDSLHVFVSQSITGSTGANNPILQNTTDTVTVVTTNGGTALSVGLFYLDSYRIHPDTGVVTKVVAGGSTFGAASGVTTNALNGNVSAFTTAWTGAWALGLRLGGNLATGCTHSWDIAVYKVAGQ